MINDLVKLSEPTIGLLEFKEEDGTAAKNCMPRYIAVVKAKFLACGCEHTVQSELDLSALRRRLGTTGPNPLNMGRVQQLLLAETRKVCRESGCPTCTGQMVRKQ